MSIPNRQATIYEINTWVWLSRLSANADALVDLGSVPSAEWDAIAQYGFDAVWLMGVWERSPAGIAVANRNPGLLADFHQTLPDYRPQDNVGSAYCVRTYVADNHLGGPAGLAIARRELARRGIGLLLDFVPNHVAPDSPRIVENPEYLLEATAADFENNPGSYIQVGDKFFACGRDPYFAPWPDVVQVNAFAPGLRPAVIELLLDIAEQCDGLRCDMAMLLINDIFARTWGVRAGPIPATEYWTDVINAVKKKHPQFLFLAEAYWDLEWQLQQQGFDLCYDKKLFDLLEREDAEGVRLYLGSDLSYQEKLVRFIENHDEPRVAASFSPAKARAAALTIATVPGAKLFYEGQFEGHKIRVPTFLARAPAELVDEACHAFYGKLLAAIDAPAFRSGHWTLCPCSGWPDNLSSQKLGAWCWTSENDRRLVIVNLGGGAVQARVRVPWDDLSGRPWRLDDDLSGASYDRDGSEIQKDGLYVELAAWGGQILVFRAIPEGASLRDSH